MSDHMIRRSTFCGVCHKRGPDQRGRDRVGERHGVRYREQRGACQQHGPPDAQRGGDGVSRGVKK